MRWPAFSGVVFEPDNPAATSTLDVLQNLLYLIRMDASNPDLVRSYVEQAELVLRQQQPAMLSDEYPC